MIQVEMISKDDCHLCDDAYEVLFRVQKNIPFDLTMRKIRDGDEHFQKYHERVPVIFINDEEAFHGKISERDLVQKLQKIRSQSKR
jgi:glutaredoxin